MKKTKAPGSLYIFEGPDGVGKTTLSKWLAEHLRTQRGGSVVWSSFPGNDEGTFGGLVYRLHHNPLQFGVSSLQPLSLQLLHVAAHIDAIEGRFKELLKEGTTIVLDRFWWSTWVYGRLAGGDSAILDAIIRVEHLVWKRIRPTKLFLVSRVVPNGGAQHRRLTRLYAQLARKEARQVPAVRVPNNGPLSRAANSIRSLLQ